MVCTVTMKMAIELVLEEIMVPLDNSVGAYSSAVEHLTADQAALRSNLIYY